MPSPAQSRTKSIADNVAVAGNQRIGLGPLRSLCSQKNKIEWVQISLSVGQTPALKLWTVRYRLCRHRFSQLNARAAGIHPVDSGIHTYLQQISSEGRGTCATCPTYKTKRLEQNAIYKICSTDKSIKLTRFTAQCGGHTNGFTKPNPTGCIAIQ